MKTTSVIKRILCVACAAVMVVSVTACGNRKSKTDNGKLTSNGYELPFEFSDGEKEYMPVVENSVYETVSTTKGGGKVVHLSTIKSKEEVQAFYDAYFEGKPAVKPKMETDTSTGYYDEEHHLVVFNLNIWTADGMTNYKMGCAKCEDITNDAVWRLANDTETATDGENTTVGEDATE